MSGLSLSQFEKLTRLGAKIDGRRVLVRAESESWETPRNTPSGYYTISVSVAEGGCLTPVGAGSVAASRLDRSDYRYTHGGRVFRQAVDAAKELASALGLPVVEIDRNGNRRYFD